MYKSSHKDRERSLKRYYENKETILPKIRLYNKTNRKKQRQILKKWIDSFKTECKQCKENNPICLCFHHLENKKFTISKILKITMNKKRIEEEIRKCEILCHNCHRKQHSNPLYLGNTKKDKLIREIKQQNSCKCGESFYASLDFHHIDSTTKIADLSTMKNNKKYTLTDILEEIKKCEVICANCHSKKHNGYD